MSRSIYDVVPSRILDEVDRLELAVLPSKARRHEEWLTGDPITGVTGQWEHKTRTIEVWLLNCWEGAFYRFPRSSWTFAAWNSFLHTLYHEFGHAEATALGLQDDSRNRLHPVDWEWKDLPGPYADKNETYAETMSMELHHRADAAGVTIPPENLGVFRKFIFHHKDVFFRNFRAYGSSSMSEDFGQFTRSHGGFRSLKEMSKFANPTVFFDCIRMQKHDLHHSKAYVRALPRVTDAGELPRGKTVVDRAGRHHTYYRHEELRRLFGREALQLNVQRRVPSGASSNLEFGSI